MKVAMIMTNIVGYWLIGHAIFNGFVWEVGTFRFSFDPQLIPGWELYFAFASNTATIGELSFPHKIFRTPNISTSTSTNNPFSLTTITQQFLER